MPATVLAPSLDQTASDLHGHPVIEEMARDLLGATPDMMATLVHETGEPTFRLICLANDRFAERTDGKHGRKLGTVAHAVLARIAELRVEAHTRLLAALPDTVTETYAAELEARQAVREMWRHGFPRCPLTRYAEAAGRAADAIALELANNPGTRTVLALRANLAHPEAGRTPRPSAKAGRAALRALDRVGRHRRRSHESAAALILEATADVVADTFLHAYETHGVEPSEIERLHDLRITGRFPSDVTDDIRQLVFLTGDLIALAEAYDWASESVIWAAQNTFTNERDAAETQ